MAPYQIELDNGALIYAQVRARVRTRALSLCPCVCLSFCLCVLPSCAFRTLFARSWRLEETRRRLVSLH